MITLTAGCSATDARKRKLKAAITNDHWPTQSWQSSAPEKQGVDFRTQKANLVLQSVFSQPVFNHNESF